MSTGEVNLDIILRSLELTTRRGPYVFASVPPEHEAVRVAAAAVSEQEGVTVVLSKEDADALGVEYDFVAAWITLVIHSSLEAVGLTAAVARSLAEAGISCNVIAGYFHDHLLVPWDTRARAVEALKQLRLRR